MPAQLRTNEILEHILDNRPKKVATQTDCSKQGDICQNPAYFAMGGNKSGGGEKLGGNFPQIF